MHELSFAQEILEHVLRQAEPYPGCTVSRLKLRVGDSLALEPASLLFSLEALAVNTAAAGAKVELEEMAPAFECAECGRVPSADGTFRCPACGGPAARVPNTDLIIEEIELNDANGQT